MSTAQLVPNTNKHLRLSASIPARDEKDTGSTVTDLKKSSQTKVKEDENSSDTGDTATIAGGDDREKKSVKKSSKKRPPSSSASSSQKKKKRKTLLDRTEICHHSCYDRRKCHH